MKEKRKTRLDKQPNATFIGFGAFGETLKNASSASASTPATPTAAVGLQLQPVYTGQDDRLALLFPRLVRRDATTKVKALKQLTELFLNDNDTNGTAQAAAATPKRVWAVGLAHYAHVYYHKLYYDASPTVRAAALAVWGAAQNLVPKAVEQLLQSTCTRTDSNGCGQPKIRGQWFTARVDSSPEVRQMYRQYELFTRSTAAVDSSNGEDGTLDFLAQVLGYGRPSVMHAALFAQEALETEQQKEFNNERFERVVGNAVDALGEWILVTADNGGDGQPPPQTCLPHLGLAVKLLASRITQLRRRAYLLFSTACRKDVLEYCTTAANDSAADDTGGDQMISKKLPNSLTHALATETEAVNIPVLLETLLVYCQYRKRHPITAPEFNTEKPLRKILQKACLGASTLVWGPMILPLVVSSSSSSRVALLQAAWKGRAVCLGPKDAVASGVLETAAFLLLQQRQQQTIDADQVIAAEPAELMSLWNEAWREIMESSNSKSSASKSSPRASVLGVIARDLVQLHQKQQDGNVATVDYQVVAEKADLGTLVQLLQILKAQREAATGPVEAAPPLGLVGALKQRFTRVLKEFQTSSASLPTHQAYDFWNAALSYAGLEVVEQLEHWVTNDILQWLVLHTTSRRLSESSAITIQQSEAWVQADASILNTVFALIGDEQQRVSMWETVLREVLRAECHLDWLVVLLSNLESKWASCGVLDQFCLSLVQFTEDSSDNAPLRDVHHLDIDDGDGMSSKKFRFFKACLGMKPCQKRLISDDVLSKWTVVACSPSISQNDSRSVLQALMAFIGDAREQIDESTIQSLVFSSWKRHGSIFQEHGLTFLIAEDSRVASFLDEAVTTLQSQLAMIPTHENNEDQAKSWSDRAARLWRVMNESKSSETRFSFGLLGLDDLSKWKQHPRIMFQCLSELYKRLPIELNQRSSLVDSSNGKTERLLLGIALSLSEASENPLEGEKAAQRQDMSARFLAESVARSHERSRVTSCVHLLIGDIEQHLHRSRNDITLLKEVSVLSQLLSILQNPVLPAGYGALSPEQIKEGDSLWYLTESDNPALRERATVVKIHFEAQTGYYFSVRLSRDGETVERQTVVERLRSQARDHSSDAVVFESLGPSDQKERSDVRSLILSKLVLPFAHEVLSSLPLSELLNIILSQVGIGLERGIGSSFFDVLQMMRDNIDKAVQSLAQGEEIACKHLRNISVALGAGINTPSVSWSLKELKLDVVPSLRAIVAFYDSKDIDSMTLDVDVSAVRWLGLCHTAGLADNVETDGIIHSSTSLLLKLCKKCFSLMESFTAESSVAIQGTVEYLRSLDSSLPPDDTLRGSRTTCFASLIDAFARSWTGASGESSNVQHSPFTDVVQLLMSNNDMRKEVSSLGASIDVDALSRAFFDASKRYVAFQLLIAIASTHVPLLDEDSVHLNSVTTKNLKSWVNSLTEEEAQELEEDVEVVSQWVPGRIMEEVESWADEDFSSLEDSNTFGRLLTWLLVLTFIDSSVPQDSRNRPAFVAYFHSCVAVPPILNLAILHDDALLEKAGRPVPVVDNILRNHLALTLREAAAITIFRTIEVLPSLAKRWFEEECPKAYLAPVQMQVEKHISPAILSRELARIKSEAVFGQMNVSASSVSREINATYVQDEFTLTVLIRLPGTFPFRSAEVDCSKTFGVPATRLKRWTLQITTMLNSQGGTIQDALMLWKENVDREFEGVEPCPVCYSVLHVKSHKLPSLQCTTCSNCFHFDCLNQWFRSSGKNQCVMCQQPWQGTRV